MSASSQSERTKKIIESSVRFSASKLKRETLPPRMNGSLAWRIARGLIKFLHFYASEIFLLCRQRESVVNCRLLFGTSSVGIWSVLVMLK